MSRIRAIVFDAGATLLYPAEPVGETYARFARAHGVKIQAEAATTAFRQALKDASPRTKCATPPEKTSKKSTLEGCHIGATPAGVGFPGMRSGGGDRFAVLPPATVLSSLRDFGCDTDRAVPGSFSFVPFFSGGVGNIS